MREIKFRAWDRVNARMYPSGELVLSEFSGSIVSLVYASRHGRLGENGKDANLLQYTGLRDKNGVEIYEGDIVKAKFVTVGNEELEYDLPTNAVCWDISEATYCVGPPNEMYLMSLGRAEELEVIGNIYQNPELLEKAS